MNLPDRFWAKVDKTNGCWLWRAGTNPSGYGRFGFEGRNWLAHRLAWITERGEIPAGLQVDHRCHEKSCVRVSHMQLVTQQENAENQAGPYRNSKTGVRGVCIDGRGFRVMVSAHGRKHSGRRYKTLAEAESAAIALRNQLMSNNLLDRRVS